MKRAKITRRRAPIPSLRAEHARLTRSRIESAVADLLRERGGVEGITFKLVARKAGVTEMTVYRHYPTRADLLRGMWEQMNRELGSRISMPQNAAQLLDQHRSMFTGFDRIPEQITASLTTTEGREMRASLNAERRRAFLAIASEVAPRASAAQTRRTAALLQLLHSAVAWFSLREQWDMSGEEAGDTTLWAIELLMKQAGERS